MSAIIKFLIDQVDEARDSLEIVEKMHGNIDDRMFTEVLASARKRLGDAAQAKSRYLDETEGLRGEIDDLREQMKPVRMEAFAQARVGHYKSIAYRLTTWIENLVDDLEDEDRDLSLSDVTLSLKRAMEQRREASRGQ